jgi:hypothetical protein
LEESDSGEDFEYDDEDDGGEEGTTTTGTDKNFE